MFLTDNRFIFIINTHFGPDWCKGIWCLGEGDIAWLMIIFLTANDIQWIYLIFVQFINLIKHRFLNRFLAAHSLLNLLVLKYT